MGSSEEAGEVARGLLVVRVCVAEPVVGVAVPEEGAIALLRGIGRVWRVLVIMEGGCDDCVDEAGALFAAMSNEDRVVLWKGLCATNGAVLRPSPRRSREWSGLQFSRYSNKCMRAPGSL